MEPDYISKNKNLWNARTDYHVQSDFYALQEFIAGESSLNDIELQLLGDIKGKSILHLQCHFGQDTLSLARLGARATGIDLSDKAIAKAQELNTQLGLDATFVCSDVYDLPNNLKGTFDIIFTSYGTIGWLPDMKKWASVIRHFLKPGGQFVFVEFHPVVWMFDNDFEKVGYNYFNDGPIIETETGSYADRDAPIHNEYVGWNHSIAEVISALLENGLQISTFSEYDYSPYSCFRHTEEFEPKKFRIKHIGNNMPMVYALSATKSN